jgi:hypothetical protein
MKKYFYCALLTLGIPVQLKALFSTALPLAPYALGTWCYLKHHRPDQNTEDDGTKIIHGILGGSAGVSILPLMSWGLKGSGLALDALCGFGFASLGTRALTLSIAGMLLGSACALYKRTHDTSKTIPAVQKTLSAVMQTKEMWAVYGSAGALFALRILLVQTGY